MKMHWMNCCTGMEHFTVSHLYFQWNLPMRNNWHSPSSSQLTFFFFFFMCSLCAGPANMAMVFPVGRMVALEEGKKISLLVCQVHPGTSYWMDEHDMPGLSREEGHVYLPSGPPEDFDSICLLGRRTAMDAKTGKRRSSLDNVRNKDLKSQYIGPYWKTCVHHW